MTICLFKLILFYYYFLLKNKSNVDHDLNSDYMLEQDLDETKLLQIVLSNQIELFWIFIVVIGQISRSYFDSLLSHNLWKCCMTLK